MFWHVPKAGGTTAKQLYQCMRKTLTIRIGVDPRYGHDQTDELVVFKPPGKSWNTVNVDTVVSINVFYFYLILFAKLCFNLLNFCVFDMFQ